MGIISPCSHAFAIHSPPPLCLLMGSHMYGEKLLTSDDTVLCVLYRSKERRRDSTNSPLLHLRVVSYCVLYFSIIRSNKQKINTRMKNDLEYFVFLSVHIHERWKRMRVCDMERECVGLTAGRAYGHDSTSKWDVSQIPAPKARTQPSLSLSLSLSLSIRYTKTQTHTR
jgi:hypothetical protein